MSKRTYCHHCGYPQSACVCAAVKPIAVPQQLVVLQHPSEVSHTKNSVRLLQLAIPQTQVIVGETAADFAALRQQLLATQCALVYPPDDAQAEVTVTQTFAQAIDTLLLLDGTWRKVHRMLCLNPWLLQLPRLSLSCDNGSQYRIRKAKRSDSLSTLEAAVFALQQLQPSLDILPCLALLDELVAQRLARMPAEVRKRY
ncbi:tRNA-uridine aminocarboxypropyltransferase [Shewanella avicenniae]|uniref:tRNA-uridine aminocarboxypropyltransferase n=1 Tax=Shewanella avicenniae TaxID=2814294 RepID=UPI001E4C305F|nr:tRNA-uridine aminocarboxypropyltransferase [Shewanella avicenniae]